MKTEIITEAFISLGENLERLCHNDETINKSKALKRIKNYADNPSLFNPWFTKESVMMAISSVAKNLKADSICKFLEDYQQNDPVKSKNRVGVVSAGNIPAVGFHDFLCVLLSGNVYIGKLSSKDNVLIREFANYLFEFNQGFENLVFFTESPLKDIDAIIATGSNNTSRYFEYYFSKYPHIIRKNRNSIGILKGNECREDIINLGKDIFSYFGLGCRSVSKIYIHKSYNVNELIDQFSDYKYILDNHKYRNNYDYYKSIFMVNGDEYYDNGFLLAKEQDALSSPVSVLHFEKYRSDEEIKVKIEMDKNNIQCVVGNYSEAIPFGSAQFPALNDFADDINTMEFLLRLK